MMTFARILLGVDDSTMPCQLLHSESAPFFGILMMIPSFQSSEIFLLSLMALKSGCKMFAVVTTSEQNMEQFPVVTVSKRLKLKSCKRWLTL